MTDTPIPAQPSETWSWELHPTVVGAPPIALLRERDGDTTDVLVATGDASQAWLEISEESMALIAALPATLARVQHLEDEVESLKAAVLRTALEANAEIDRLKKLLDRDQTGLAAALNRCRQVGKGYFWIALGEWGSYDYTEQTQKTLREEIGRCLEEIENTAVAALRESGTRAAAAFQPERDRLAVVEGLLAGYEREAPRLRARMEAAEAALADLRSKHGADAQNEREMWGDAGRPRG